MRLINFSLITAFTQARLRQHGRCARTNYKHSIGVGGHQLERLPSYRRVRTLEALHCIHTYTSGSEWCFHGLKPNFPVCICKTDKAKAFHAGALHHIDQCTCHDPNPLRRDKGPGVLVARLRWNRCHGDDRCARLGAYFNSR